MITSVSLYPTHEIYTYALVESLIAAEGIASHPQFPFAKAFVIYHGDLDQFTLKRRSFLHTLDHFTLAKYESDEWGFEFHVLAPDVDLAETADVAPSLLFDLYVRPLI
jgi:hypothetical protein